MHIYFLGRRPFKFLRELKSSWNTFGIEPSLSGHSFPTLEISVFGKKQNSMICLKGQQYGRRRRS